MKDQLNLSVSVAVGSSIVSLFHFSSMMKLILVQANHPFHHSVSAYHVQPFADNIEYWVKVHGHPWMDHGQATGFII